MTPSEVAVLLKRVKRLHFVGIGGSGMFPLVEILHAEGYAITGSDVNEGSIINAERALGIPVSIGHDANNVRGTDALVVTAALLAGNVEVAAANAAGIPVIERAALLGYISTLFPETYCVSGTHGKTTTTSMLTSVFMAGGLDPSAVIGGKLPLIGGYGRRGHSDNMVIEACEFKDTFLHLSPAYAVILNIDEDHLDYFGSLDGIKRSFRRFAQTASKAIIANGDDDNTMDALAGVDPPVITYGTRESCDYVIYDIENYNRAFYSFRLRDKNGEIGTFRLNVPGEHNVHNAAAAVCCGARAGISAADIQTGLESFHGAGRRFEMLGEFGGITIADDYAHHPTELRVTLEAAKHMGYNRVFAVFQPFTYSRTVQHLDAFAAVLPIADQVVMTEIMGSRETNTYNIYTKDLADKIPGSVWFNTFEEICDYCLAHAKSGDLILTLGCGDIYKAANMMVERCRTYN